MFFSQVLLGVGENLAELTSPSSLRAPSRRGRVSDCEAVPAAMCGGRTTLTRECLYRGRGPGGYLSIESSPPDGRVPSPGSGIRYGPLIPRALPASPRPCDELSRDQHTSKTRHQKKALGDRRQDGASIAKLRTQRRIAHSRSTELTSTSPPPQGQNDYGVNAADSRREWTKDDVRVLKSSARQKTPAPKIAK